MYLLCKYKNGMSVTKFPDKKKNHSGSTRNRALTTNEMNNISFKIFGKHWKTSKYLRNIVSINFVKKFLNRTNIHGYQATKT